MKFNPAPTKENAKKLKALYRSAFPRSERKPYAVMLKKQAEGIMELMTIENDDGKFLGLVITILHNDIVLLDYFAVSPECRGQGIGSEVLKELSRRYPGKTILLEIEDPEVPNENQADRIRRKAFYLRNGMVCQDFKINFFGVEMLVLTNGAKVTFEEYHAIFEAHFSRTVQKNIRLRDE